MKAREKHNFLSHDIGIIALSVLIAVIMVKANVLGSVLNGAVSLKFLGSFIAGIFFTSAFTITPAMVTLGQIAQSHSPVEVAFFGALGALLGDLIIFKFIRDKLSEHLLELMKHNSSWKRVLILFRLKYFRWLTFLVGGLILASPLPDELAVGLFGFSKMKTKTFIPLSFTFNFLGILAIGLFAKSL